MELGDVRLDEAQVLDLALLNLAVLEAKAEVLHDAVVVVAFAYVHRQRVVIVDGVDELEEVRHVDTDDYLFVDAVEDFEVLGVQEEVDEDGVRLVHRHDADPVRLERYVGFEKDVLERGHQDSERRDLNRFDSENVVRIVVYVALIVHA